MIEKEELYRRLGAEKFQKIVFWIEKAKYYIIDTCFPEIDKWTEKRWDRYLKRQQNYLKWKKESKGYQKVQKVGALLRQKMHLPEKPKEESPLDEKELKRQVQREKMLFRKERIRRQNRNYHQDRNHPTQIISYLENNKKIHLTGMIKDGVLILCSVTSVLLLGTTPLGILFLIVGSVLLAVDFECVNLQNYNLCRLSKEKVKKRLEKEENRRTDENFQKLSEVINSVAELVQEKESLPTVDEVVDQVQTKEEIEQLLTYAIEELQYLQSLKGSSQKEQNIPKQKKLGERK